jgi:hypothetical protein
MLRIDQEFANDCRAYVKEAIRITCLSKEEDFDVFDVGLLPVMAQIVELGYSSMAKGRMQDTKERYLKRSFDAAMDVTSKLYSFYAEGTAMRDEESAGVKLTVSLFLSSLYKAMTEGFFSQIPYVTNGTVYLAVWDQKRGRYLSQHLSKSKTDADE